MFSYIMLGTNNLPRAIQFYDPLMELLGQPQAGRNEEGASWGTFSDNHTVGLCIGRPFDRQPASVGNGTMVALNARSVEHIEQLHTLALSLGGADEGAPGHRPQVWSRILQCLRTRSGRQQARVCLLRERSLKESLSGNSVLAEQLCCIVKA